MVHVYGINMKLEENFVKIRYGKCPEISNTLFHTFLA